LSDKVIVSRELKLKRKLFKKGSNNNNIASSIRVRKPKKRNDGREDYSEVSELICRETMPGRFEYESACNLTEAIAEDLGTYIKRGLDLKRACQLSGVSFPIFCSWRKKYPLFNDYITRCEAEAEADALLYIKNAMTRGRWQASAWFLERKYPHKYGRRDMLKQEFISKYNEFIKIVLEVINNEDPRVGAKIVSALRDRKIDFGDQD